MKKRILDGIGWVFGKIGDIISGASARAARKAVQEAAERAERERRRWERIAEQYNKQGRMTEMGRAFVNAEESRQLAERLRSQLD
jgi:hypothetical protein